jgi:hypothetical protein
MNRRSGHDELKRREERTMFRQFVAAGGLNLQEKSLRSLAPPRPDISCRIDGDSSYFEITRMRHPRSANQMGRHLSEIKRAIPSRPPAPDTYDDRAALRDAIARKSTKAYATGDRRLGLLVWADGVYHPAGMPASWARSILADIGPGSRWSQIWVFDRPGNRVVASWRQRRRKWVRIAG